MSDTVIAATMDGILDALAGGGWTHYLDVDASIRAHGGDVDRKRRALKRLRDIGFPIVVDKHAEHTQWKAYPTDVELVRFDRGAHVDTYSRVVTNHRSFVGQYRRQPSLELDALVQASELAVVSLGRRLGKTLVQIAADLEPAVT